MTSRLLLISASARSLAASAARAGIRPNAIDLYGDADTVGFCGKLETVAPGDPTFDAEQLVAVADRLAPQRQNFGLVVGSGLDGAPAVLERLAQGRQLFGNPPDLIRWVKSPRRFFDLLSDLDIPFPPSVFSAPADPAGWLFKSGCGEGGKGVGFCAHSTQAAKGYWQRYLAGTACSALFIADGTDFRLIGFNTLLSIHLRERPFLFTGAINRAPLDREQQTLLRVWIGRLVRVLQLRGLNTLDFIASQRGCHALEINPRPGATLRLYDPEFPQGLVSAHLQACRGRLPDVICPNPVRGFNAVFAPDAIRLNSGLAWPDYATDHPPAGREINAGEPFCSVEAEGADAADVLARLQARSERIKRQFFPHEAARPVPSQSKPLEPSFASKLNPFFVATRKP